MKLICDQFVSGRRFLWYNLNRIETKVSTFRRHDSVVLALAGKHADYLVRNKMQKRKDERMEVVIAQDGEMLNKCISPTLGFNHPLCFSADCAVLHCVVSYYIVVALVKFVMKLKACEDHESESDKNLFKEFLAIFVVTVWSDIRRITSRIISSCALIASLLCSYIYKEDLHQLLARYKALNHWFDSMTEKRMRYARKFDERKKRADALENAMRKMWGLTEMNGFKGPDKNKDVQSPEWNS